MGETAPAAGWAGGVASASGGVPTGRSGMASSGTLSAGVMSAAGNVPTRPGLGAGADAGAGRAGAAGLVATWAAAAVFAARPGGTPTVASTAPLATVEFVALPGTTWAAAWAACGSAAAAWADAGKVPVAGEVSPAGAGTAGGFRVGAGGGTSAALAATRLAATVTLVGAGAFAVAAGVVFAVTLTESAPLAAVRDPAGAASLEATALGGTATGCTGGAADATGSAMVVAAGAAACVTPSPPAAAPSLEARKAVSAMKTGKVRRHATRPKPPTRVLAPRPRRDVVPRGADSASLSPIVHALARDSPIPSVKA